MLFLVKEIGTEKVNKENILWHIFWIHTGSVAGEN